MIPGQSPQKTQRSLVFAFRALTIVSAICTGVVLLSPASRTAERDLPRNALWEVVHNLCVPGQQFHHDPKPCLQVDLNGGREKGFAILRDPRGGTQFLLIPTVRISGIESPIVRGPNATNYFARAWESRVHLNEDLHRTLPRDAIGLAINSAQSRTQDQLHIHVSCIRSDVSEALHKNEGKIGNQWALFNVPFVGHVYMAIWVPGEHLNPNNPFRILGEELSGASRDMTNRSLVVIGFTRTGGIKGFVILAGHAYKDRDLGNGEELLDNACHIAAMQQ
jgi:CDP-diacylglycerol pyrophosphatase